MRKTTGVLITIFLMFIIQLAQAACNQANMNSGETGRTPSAMVAQAPVGAKACNVTEVVNYVLVTEHKAYTSVTIDFSVNTFESGFDTPCESSATFSATTTTTTAGAFSYYLAACGISIGYTPATSSSNIATGFTTPQRDYTEWNVGYETEVATFNYTGMSTFKNLFGLTLSISPCAGSDSVDTYSISFMEWQCCNPDA